MRVLAAGVDDSRIALGLVITIVVIVLGYGVSLVVHPYTRCRACRGTSRHRGAIYTYAFRKCRKCGGSGRKLRRGVRIFRSPESDDPY